MAYHMTPSIYIARGGAGRALTSDYTPSFSLESLCTSALARARAVPMSIHTQTSYRRLPAVAYS